MNKRLTLLPQETRVYYDRGLVAIYFPFVILCFFLGLGLLFFTQIAFSGAIISLIFLIKFLSDYRIYKDRTPQLVINYDGIKAGKSRFIHWHEITRCEVVYSPFRKGEYFVIESVNISKRYDVMLWGIEINRLKELIRVYRFEQ